MSNAIATTSASMVLCLLTVLGCGGESTTASAYTPGQTDTAIADTPVVSDSGHAADSAADFVLADAPASLPGDGQAEILKDAMVAEVSVHETSDADAGIPPDILINPSPCKSNEECQPNLVPGTLCLEAICVEGVCKTEDSPDGSACDPENQCVVDATCVSGECQGSPLNCDDENPCMDDSCDEAVGCIHAANQVPCDNNDLCTKADHCGEGVCQSGNPVICDDFNPCTTDGCLSESGCFHEGNAQPCDDGNACTTGDACKAGACGGSAVNCNDQNPCTDDTCDAKLGCKATANTAPCDDDNACTIGDACKSGQCASGATKTCATDGGCAVGACSPVDGKCKFADAADGTLCNDGNACSESDACKNGLCVGKPVVCDDTNPCTQDACDPKVGCTYVTAGGACDLDDNACTTDQCIGGACTAGSGKVCDDGNPCTADKCDVKTGLCVYDDNAYEGVGCDADGSLCTVGDICKSGQCAAGKALNCDDGNVCTDDACDAKAGCTHKANTASCDADGSACTMGDACKSGACVAGVMKACDDFNSCTDDACDLKTGFCMYVNNTAGCSDGDACTKDDVCSNGQCKGTPTACDPCMNYGGTVLVVTTDHINVCNAKDYGSDLVTLAIPKPWHLCSVADMLKYAPAKTFCSFAVDCSFFGTCNLTAWVGDACTSNGQPSHKFIECTDNNLLNNANSYQCYNYGNASFHFMTCRD